MAIVKILSLNLAMLPASNPLYRNMLKPNQERAFLIAELIATLEPLPDFICFQAGFDQPALQILDDCLKKLFPHRWLNVGSDKTKFGSGLSVFSRHAKSDALFFSEKSQGSFFRAFDAARLFKDTSKGFLALNFTLFQEGDLNLSSPKMIRIYNTNLHLKNAITKKCEYTKEQIRLKRDERMAMIVQNMLECQVTAQSNGRFDYIAFAGGMDTHLEDRRKWESKSTGASNNIFRVAEIKSLPQQQLSKLLSFQCPQNFVYVRENNPQWDGAKGGAGKIVNLDKYSTISESIFPGNVFKESWLEIRQCERGIQIPIGTCSHENLTDILTVSEKTAVDLGHKNCQLVFTPLFGNLSDRLAMELTLEIPD